MEREEMQRLINLSLNQKIKQSKKIIRQTLEEFGSDNLAIAWTGGKDSTTMLWLYLEVCKELAFRLPTAMFIDEGYVFDEILELVKRMQKEWAINLVVAKNTDVSQRAKRIGDVVRVAELNDRNRRELTKLGYTNDAFDFEPESYVGNHLMKTVPMNVFLEENNKKALSVAIRWDEQQAREGEDYFSPRTDPPHVRVHPIIHFRERDIWDTIFRQKIPFCSLYYKGYRSLGARGSTTKASDIPAWEQDLENTPERVGRGQDKEKIMEQLRSLGYM